MGAVTSLAHERAMEMAKYAKTWKRERFYRSVVVLAVIVGFVGIPGAGVVGAIFGSGVVSGVIATCFWLSVVGTGIAALVSLALWNLMRCPRCAHAFDGYRNRPASRCVNCGLPRGAPYDPDKAEG